MMINRYEAYKDSGVEWLSEVPAHWGISHLKRLSQKITDGAHTSPDLSSDDYPFLTVVNLNNRRLDFENCLFTSHIDYEKLVRNGCQPKKYDVLYSKDGTISEAVVIDEDRNFVVGSSFIIVRPHLKTSNSDYLCHLLSSAIMRYQARVYVKGASLPRISIFNIAKLIAISPPLPEQTAIAAYLDTKTAQIDRKIELLSQKAAQYGKLKQSLINETVTRGLDKTVPMKDSGVEWIGKVPAHWEVKRVKELGSLVLGKMLDNVKSENTFYRSYLKSKNIGWLKVEDSNIEKMYFSLAEMKNYRLKKNDILLSEGGEVGKTCFWNDEIEECYIQNSVHKITIYKNNTPRFFLYQSYLLGSIKYYDSIVSHVSIKHLTKEKLSRVNWVRPPFEEQTAIANYLNEKTAHIDRIVATINSQIDKLKELRKTLINDVVTGKIKVA